MTALTPAQVIEVVRKQEEKFAQLDLANGRLLSFEQECLFARQQILKSDHTLKVAATNPNSLQAAILNVAAIGISLNPALAHAYLVPRGGAICLDVSYQGLKKIATDSGSIKVAKAELVYAADTFEWHGAFDKPTHAFNPFASEADRGAFVGAYCIAILADDSVMCEAMSAAEVYKVRDSSKAGSGPWQTWFAEMAKKTVIKRAYKSWPQTANRQRLDTAVAVLHETEGAAYTIEQQTEFMRLVQSGDDVGLFLFVDALGEDDVVLPALFNSFGKGELTAGKKKVRDLTGEGQRKLIAWRDQLAAAIDANDDAGVQEMLEVPPAARDYMLNGLTGEQMHKLQALRAA